MNVLENIIEKITKEVESRIVHNLENLEFEISVKVKRGEDESMPEVQESETDESIQGRSKDQGWSEHYV